MFLIACMCLEHPRARTTLASRLAGFEKSHPFQVPIRCRPAVQPTLTKSHGDNQWPSALHDYIANTVFGRAQERDCAIEPRGGRRGWESAFHATTLVGRDGRLSAPTACTTPSPRQPRPLFIHCDRHNRYTSPAVYPSRDIIHAAHHHHRQLYHPPLHRRHGAASSPRGRGLGQLQAITPATTTGDTTNITPPHSLDQPTASRRWVSYDPRPRCPSSSSSPLCYSCSAPSAPRSSMPYR